MSFAEEVVARIDTLDDHTMTQVSVGETEVLLVRRGDEYFAYQAHCTHYGAPLAEGALSGDRIVCPWHHACFHARTGDQLEPPGLDSLERYEVRIEGDDVIVRVPEDASPNRILDMARRDESDPRTFVILGGGAAGEYAAEALREKAFRGRIIMITREAQTPYDRPNCSKDYLQGQAPEEWMYLRGEEFYDERDIERWHGRTVTRLDAQRKTLLFADGEELSFDGLVLCTGGIPRQLDVPGMDLRGVFTLRSYDDATMILRAGQEARRAVVIGASFIGMEAAYSLKTLGVEEVTVVGPERVPFARVFGERVGAMVRQIHEENGVRFRLGTGVTAFHGDGSVREVVLDDGSKLEADLVLVGIGVRPATGFIEGLELAEDGSVVVDEYLRAADGIYAAGDIAQFSDWRSGGRLRVEHWRVACQHGRLAGYNLAGENRPYRSIPFFWTAHFGTNLRYVGFARQWDEIIYDGLPEERSFIAFYREGDRVLAAVGCGRDQEMAAIEELLRRDLMPPVDVLRERGFDYLAPLKE